MSLLFNILYMFVIAFTQWLQSLFTVILEAKSIKSVTVSTFPLSICHEVMRPLAMILVFWMLCFKPAFSLSSFTLIKRLLSSSSLSAIKVVSSAYILLLHHFGQCLQNGILLNHKKELNWVICSDLDEPRVFQTKWSKSERKNIIY